MTLQQWLFSIKGRIGRRDFWIWIAIWLVTMSALFTLAGSNLLNPQTAAFIIVCLLWPTAAWWWSSGCTIAANPSFGRC